MPFLKSAHTVSAGRPCARLLLACLLTTAPLFAAEPGTVDQPPVAPVAPNDPAAATTTPAATEPLPPATKAMLERLQSLRANLSDEDGPTRDKALAQIRAESNALIEALFRMPPDEDSTDQRRMLVMIANELESKIQYESNLMHLPAANRAAVDAMLKKIPGFQTFFSAATEERLKFLDQLCAAKPDPATLVVFLGTLLTEKDPHLVIAVLDHAADAPSPAYLPMAEDLLKKGFVELYMPKEINGNQMQMMMYNRGMMGDYSAWYSSLLKLVTAIPGEGSDKLLTELFTNLTTPNQNQIVMMQGNRGNSNQLLFDLATAIVKRGIQSAFPDMIKAAEQHSLMESGMRINNNPIQYSSGADLMVYTAYRLIDPKIAEQTAGQYGGLSWKSSEERLKFYDDFLTAWKADITAKKANRDGLEAYQQWYDNNRTQMAQLLENEKKQRGAQK